MDGTKWSIFKAAVKLFADKGYSNVSIRDIAALIEIRPSSIYHHFSSKAEILDTIVDFYNRYHAMHMPALKELLCYAQTASPRDVLRRTIVQYEDDMQELMLHIFLIVSMEALSGNWCAQESIYQNMFELPKQYFHALFAELYKLGKIGETNASTFSLAFSSLCHSALLRVRSAHPVSWDEWNRSIELLFDTV